MPFLPGTFWLGKAATDRVLSMGQIEINYVLALNLIVRNRTVFGIETVLLC